MHWFAADERGLALGIRQTAIPLGGLVAALALPAIAASGGSEAAFLFLAALCGVGALVGAVVLRGRDAVDGIEAASVPRTLVDGKLWRLSVGSGLYLYAQVAVIGFGVLFLHDEHGLSEGRAALVIAASQALAVALRIGAGRWSDLVGARIVPLRRIGIAVTSVMVLTAVLAGGPLPLLVPALALAGGLTMAWNGLSFTAAAELAGPDAERSRDRPPADGVVGRRHRCAGAVRGERRRCVLGRRLRCRRAVPARRVVGAAGSLSERRHTATSMRVLERLDELYAIGGGPGANRPHDSPEEDAAHALVAGWMREAGLAVEVDAHGNLFGRSIGA